MARTTVVLLAWVLVVVGVPSCTDPVPDLGSEDTGGSTSDDGPPSDSTHISSGSASGSATGSPTSSPTGDTDPSDTGSEPVCGNGVVEVGEACDDEGESAVCDDDCTPVDCGDSLLNEAAGEQCDEGGPTDTCNIDCTLPVAQCGNGVIDSPREECDDAGETESCDSDCTAVACGDGVTNTAADEECDDGEPSAACDADCTAVVCGDSLANAPAGEACDASDLGGQTCEGLGLGSGTLACTTGCSYETSDCSPGVPVPSLVFSPVKRFDFAWAGVPGAEHYQLLESTGPGAPYVQLGGDIVGTSASFEMPLHLRLAASYVLRACNAAGCTDSAAVGVVGSLADAVGYAKASNTDAGDLFGGYAVAISGDGNTLAVGAYEEDSSATGIDGNQASNAAVDAGAVYVLVHGGLGSWSQQAYIKASNTGPGDYFGIGLALSDDGNTLAVGARAEDSSATGIGGSQASNAASDSGAVYVFVRNGMGAWSQQAYVKASNTGVGDYFGQDVALSDDGNTLAVGAPLERSSATGVGGNQADDGAIDSGAAYVFVRNGMGAWSQQVYVKASNTDAGDSFGVRVALSDDGNTLAVSAFFEGSDATGVDGNQADDATPGAGAVYVFVRNGMGAWSQQAYVKASNTDTYDLFGVGLALSGDGNTLAVGAYLEDSEATGIGGDQGNDLADGSGAVYVFVRNGMGAWSQQAYVKASNTGVGDQLGVSLALSDDGNVLAVGARDERSSATGIDGDQANDGSDGAGAVYVLVRSGIAWSQRAYVKASNTGASDRFGASVALSADGDTLAVGAEREASSATGIGGNQASEAAYEAGAVYLY